MKFHFKTQQGIQCMSNAEGEELIAKDRESSQRDLYEAIEKGDFPKWKVQVQIMPELDADTYPIHPFDITKVWPHKDYPMIDVGMMELNRNPRELFRGDRAVGLQPVEHRAGHQLFTRQDAAGAHLFLR